jgi:hypothetical protein
MVPLGLAGAALRQVPRAELDERATAPRPVRLFAGSWEALEADHRLTALDERDIPAALVPEQLGTGVLSVLWGQPEGGRLTAFALDKNLNHPRHFDLQQRGPRDDGGGPAPGRSAGRTGGSMSESQAHAQAPQAAVAPAEGQATAQLPAVQATLARVAGSREVQGDAAGIARGGLAGGGALPHGDALQVAFGAYDLSGIEATVGGPAQAASAELGATAFAHGEQVGFAAAPDLFTAAHEATHVLQQRSGMAPAGLDGGDEDALEQQADQVASAVVQGQAVEGLLGTLVGPAIQAQQAAAGAVQRRRLPGEAELGGLLPGGGPDEAAHMAGLTRLLERSVGELNAAQRQQVLERLLHDAPGAGFWEKIAFLGGLNQREQLLRIAGALRATFPQTTLGDPALIDTGPRPATADAANIRTLVNNANALFDQALAPARRADLEQVFGRAHVSTARARYTAAKRRMNTLHRQNKVVTDRSGYNAEVSLGGLTGPNQISLAPEVIDQPNDHENIVIMLHESMHAGNGTVDDFGYIGTPSFTQLEAAVKLNNAAHYEVVPRRIFRPDGRLCGHHLRAGGHEQQRGDRTHPHPPGAGHPHLPGDVPAGVDRGAQPALHLPAGVYQPHAVEHPRSAPGVRSGGGPPLLGCPALLVEGDEDDRA